MAPRAAYLAIVLAGSTTAFAPGPRLAAPLVRQPQSATITMLWGGGFGGSSFGPGSRCGRFLAGGRSKGRDVTCNMGPFGTSGMGGIGPPGGGGDGGGGGSGGSGSGGGRRSAVPEDEPDPESSRGYDKNGNKIAKRCEDEFWYKEMQSISAKQFPPNPIELFREIFYYFRAFCVPFVLCNTVAQPFLGNGVEGWLSCWFYYTLVSWGVAPYVIVLWYAMYKPVRLWRERIVEEDYLLAQLQHDRTYEGKTGYRTRRYVCAENANGDRSCVPLSSVTREVAPSGEVTLTW